MKPLLCIYHSDCADGFTAAWAVWRAHPDAEFYPGVHGTPPPDVTGRDVVLVDFAYKRPEMLHMAEQAQSILVLDHHKSAQAELVDLPGNVLVNFDLTRSGAMLAWQWFHTTPAPIIVQHVQDRDLWRFEYPNTKSFSAALFSMEYTFDNWNYVDALSNSEDGYAGFINEGRAIGRKHMKDVHELIRVGAYRTNVAGFDVPILNCAYFHSSDAGHLMGIGEPFAVCYSDTELTRNFSLRSVHDGQDVSVIAAHFGGGGHKHASGFKLRHEDLYKLSSPIGAA